MDHRPAFLLRPLSISSTPFKHSLSVFSFFSTLFLFIGYNMQGLLSPPSAVPTGLDVPQAKNGFRALPETFYQKRFRRVRLPFIMFSAPTGPSSLYPIGISAGVCLRSNKVFFFPFPSPPKDFEFVHRYGSLLPLNMLGFFPWRKHSEFPTPKIINPLFYPFPLGPTGADPA